MKKKEPPAQFDLGLGGIFKGLGNFIQVLSDLTESGEEEIVGEREFQGKGKLKGLKGVYGFSVRVGAGGLPRVESFGNIRKTERGTVVEEVREPIVDLFDEDSTIQVIAELPGVTSESIELDAQGDILTINAEGEDRKYSKEVLLPTTVDPNSLEKNYRNGILEIRLKKVSSDQ